MTDKTPTQEPMWDDTAVLDMVYKFIKENLSEKIANDMNNDGSLYDTQFYAGARWQFEKDKAQLEKMAEEKSQLWDALEAKSAQALRYLQDLFQEKQQLAKLQQQNEKYRQALDRLASSEAFAFPKEMTKEEKMRIEFAKEALEAAE